MAETGVALVTGGTSGVGHAVARRLAGQGITVYATGRTVERSDTAVDDSGGLVRFRQADSRDGEALQAVIDEVAATGMPITHLVSAGGDPVIGPRPFSELGVAEIRAEMDAMFAPHVAPLSVALPYIADGSSIVLLTTDAGRVATPGESVLGAYAAAVMMLTRTVARELAPRWVRVNAVSMTMTAGTRSWERATSEGGIATRLLERASERFPFGQAPMAEDVADTVAFLLSNSARHVTGQVISVNGGLSFGGW